MIVTGISKEDYTEWLLKKHYLKRMCSVTYAFGLYIDNILCGVCTFGKPASHSLLIGVCGKKNSEYVYELNRLCVNDNLPKNTLSKFLGKCLKMLPSLIIISYADTSVGHNGYIYQATNWIYTGLSAKRKDYKIKGYEHLHSTTIMDKFRNTKNRIKIIREEYGENLYTEDRPRKHRYIYFTGNKRQNKKWFKELQYKKEKYPKGKNKRYDSSYKPTIQLALI